MNAPLRRTPMKPAIVRMPRTVRGAQFMDALSQRLDGPWERATPRLERFGRLKDDITCQSSSSKLALLEAAATTLRPGELYLEVGAYTGASAIAAARAGENVKVMTVDNFSQDGSIPAVLRANLERYGVSERVEVVEGDCFEVLRRPLPPVGVYLFDGPHRYIDQYLALELALPHLRDEAIVIVDDTRWRHVSRANLDFVRSHPQLSMLCDLPAQSLRDEHWWNGVQVFEFQTSVPEGGRDLVFHLNRLRDEALRPMDRLVLYHRARGMVVQRWRPLRARTKRRLRDSRRRLSRRLRGRG